MSTTPALPIAVSFSSAAPAALQVDATASLTVMVTNDAANAGVKWSVTLRRHVPAHFQNHFRCYSHWI
jgi:hypothetical protein